MKSDIPMGELRNDATLRQYIRAAHERLQEKGPKLVAWTFPEA